MWAPLIQPLRPFALRQTADVALLTRSGARPSTVQHGLRTYTSVPRRKPDRSIAIATTAAHGSGSKQAQSKSSSIAFLVGTLGLASYATWHQSRMLYCEPLDELRGYANKASEKGVGMDDHQGRDPASGEYPKSDVNVYNLGFGTVCGICAGVFIKKGAKLVAFLLGGGFILLQYLNTQRIIKIDWRAMGRRYDNVVHSAAGEEGYNPKATGWRDSTAARLWNRFTHFLTADFPSRGTFLAGVVLGLRLG